MSNLAIEFTPSNDIGSPKRRNVRRRLVQSTLLPHRPQEPDNKADEKETGCRQDGRGEEELCINEGEKRKSRGKATTPSEGSKRDKKRRNNTPKRNASPRKTPRKNALANRLKGSTSGQLLDDFSQTDAAPVPDLRQEAKLSAKESSRIFSGRQIHPFFSLWKAAKKLQGTAESEGSLCASERKDEPITCGPIHVYEKTQDDAVPLDWKKWTFLGEVASVDCALDCSIPLVLEGSVETIKFDRLISNLKLSSASSPQNAAPCSDGVSIEPQNLQEISATNSSVLAKGGTVCFQTLEDAKVDLEVDKADTSSGQAGIPGNSDAMPQSRFLEESMRSYYHSYDNKAEGSLWTYKYKPTKAIEVCGNDESVNSLSDWLHCWHERCYRSRKDSSVRDKHDFPDKDDDDDDYDCSHSDYDSDDINDKDSLQNVLLITGPVGSGKSAAVYACAQEQGFDILELNASDCRNGTAVKHYFGDTLGSHRFKSSLEHTGVPHKRKNMKLPLAPVLPICKQADKLNDGAVEVISISDDEAHNPGGSSQRLPTKENGFRCGDKAHTLILVEDVDILFPEDRGCIAAIQQIAETAKGPIILTSNSNNPVLPDNFDRLHIGFSLPYRKELLCHLHMVCVTEGVNVHPISLEKFIHACNGDMRKTIMHLQFWLHSEKFSKDRIVQTEYGWLPFDLEAGHQILPKIIPWTFPSQLSELIEEEVSKSVNVMEENSTLQKSVGELDINEMQNKLDVLHEGTDYIEAKKRELLKRNGSATGCCEFETQFSDIYEFSDSPGISVSFSEQNVRRKLVVMSSDSEDESLNNGDLLDKCNATNKAVLLADNNEFHSEFPLNQNCSSPSLHDLVCSGLEDSEEDHKIPITADDTCLNETCQSFDISFVPETVISSGIESMSGAVSSGHASGPLEVSINNELTPFSFNACKSIIARSPQNLDLLGKTEIPESSERVVANDFLHENMEINAVYNVMDECSRVDFHQKSDFVKSYLSKETDVQKLWRKLRDCRTDLRQHATLEQQGALQVVKLAYGLSNLISEADLLFRHHKKECGISEPPDFLSDEATFGWYDEQMMMTTVSSHGFCFYAKHIADVGSKLGCEGKVDLMSGILTSKTNTLALGKLSRLDLTNCTNIYAGMELEINKPRNDLLRSEIKTSLLDVFHSIVPARLFLALRGAASYEYISTMRQISRSEAVRLSQGTENTRRRGRGALHYLSRGNIMLSPEDISLLCEGDLYRKISFEAENKLT